MQQYLSNLANIQALRFCKEYDIDPSGSHIEKQPRRQAYNLVRSETGAPIITVFFHKSSVPTFIKY